MNDCCGTGAGACFTKSAARYARRYRRRGLDRAQRELRDGLLAEGISGRSVLDVGCGAGGLLIELLHRGASSGMGIDISQGMIEAAGLLARERGVATKVRFQTGDFAALEDDATRAEIVIMDKVLCCSSDPGGLIARASASGAENLAVSYPRDGFLPRASFTLMNFMGRVLRWSFYPCYHEPHALDRLLAATGFHEIRRSATPFWQIVILKRG